MTTKKMAHEVEILSVRRISRMKAAGVILFARAIPAVVFRGVRALREPPAVGVILFARAIAAVLKHKRFPRLLNLPIFQPGFSRLFLAPCFSRWGVVIPFSPIAGFSLASRCLCFSSFSS
jgi:hypothetical protein